MRALLMTTTFVASLARRDKTRIYEVFNTPECQGFLPARGGVGESRRFTHAEARLLMLLCDLARWGLTVPFAGKLVSRIAETLDESPAASSVTAEFCANGAVNFFTGEGDQSSQSRFRLTFDLTAFDAAIAEAVAAEPRTVGAEEDA